MSDTKPLVLYVDDEPNFAKFYVRKLEEVFQVLYVENADEALKVLSEQTAHIAAMVLDIMMPTPPSAEDHETDSGIETGLWLLDMYQRRSGTSYPFPVVILTARRVDLIEASIARRELDGSAIQIRRKLDTAARALPGIVQTAIAGHGARS